MLCNSLCSQSARQEHTKELTKGDHGDEENIMDVGSLVSRCTYKTIRHDTLWKKYNKAHFENMYTKVIHRNSIPTEQCTVHLILNRLRMLKIQTLHENAHLLLTIGEYKLTKNSGISHTKPFWWFERNKWYRLSYSCQTPNAKDTCLVRSIIEAKTANIYKPWQAPKFPISPRRHIQQQ